MRVGIDARLIDGLAGGVQQVLMGLAAGLSRASADGDEFVFLTVRDRDAWLRPYVSGPCRILAVEDPPAGPSLVARVLRRLRRDLGPVPIPQPKPLVERERFDVIHLMCSTGFLTASPTIYHPWDLQHVHLPELFPPYVRRVREVWYRTFSERAAIVCVAAEFTRQDAIRHLGVPPGKIAVVPMAPITTEYREADVSSLQLPDEFLLYPAQTYLHKNHLRLIEALALLRDRDGLHIPLIATGTRNEFFYPDIARRVDELRMGDQVRFTGYVAPEVLATLYRRCRAMVFPSLFEGFGMPIVEAFHAGAPVASSNAASLPEVAGDAALLFDATSVDAIADAVRRIWTDGALRGALRERGLFRARAFSWDGTAAAFRALYVRASAGRAG